jgi:hypothetical protein
MNSVFSTPSFKFYTFDKTILEHEEFALDLYNDPSIRRYIKDIDMFIYEPFNGLFDSSYLVGEEYGDLVGFLSMYSYKDYISLMYAIDKKYRGIRNCSNETIGCQMLKETSEFIFKRNAIMKNVEMFIEKSNIRSAKTAIKAGFINDEGFLYHKYR